MTYSADDLLHVILHEVGHALGLEHPFEGDVRLDPTVDNTEQTVTSYTRYDSKLGPIDIDALRVRYGDDASDGTHIASWSWNAATATMTRTGAAGADTIRGVSTVDVIRGMGGHDVIAGGKGNDRLDGGADDDHLDGNDRLTDFASEDTVQLAKSIFAALGTGTLGATAFKNISKAAADLDDRIPCKQATGELFHDADGSGKTAAVTFAVLDNKATLTAPDFFVV